MTELNAIDRVYHELMEDILKNGYDKGDRTGTGTKSVFGRQIRFHMRHGFPLLTTKKLHIRSILHELLWFLNGDTNIKYLNDNGVTIWDEWSDEDGNLGPVYGKQWVDWQGFQQGWNAMADSEYSGEFDTSGINQIQNIIDQLNNNPDSRRIMVNAWNVAELEKMALPPCHYGFQLYTRELTPRERYDLWFANNYETGMESHFDENDLPDYDHEYYTPTPTRELSFMWNQRSVDTFLGLPFNIASYALLLHMIAQQTNMVPGELIGNLGDTHLYVNHLDYVEQQLKRDSKEYGKARLKLNKAKDIFSYKFEDFEIVGYDAHPNWKGVPIAV